MTKRGLLDKVDQLPRELLAAPPPYDSGLKLVGLGMSHVESSDVRDIAQPLWLMWGSLTDGVDGPGGGDPEMVRWAEDGMRRAAGEWLALPDDDVRRAAYFDRWVFDECGYARPPGDDGNA